MSEGRGQQPQSRKSSSPSTNVDLQAHQSRHLHARRVRNWHSYTSTHALKAFASARVKSRDNRAMLFPEEDAPALKAWIVKRIENTFVTLVLRLLYDR